MFSSECDMQSQKIMRTIRLDQWSKDRAEELTRVVAVGLIPKEYLTQVLEAAGSLGWPLRIRGWAGGVVPPPFCNACRLCGVQLPTAGGQADGEARGRVTSGER